MAKFEPEGDAEVDHVTMKGIHAGKSHKKRDWKHKYSDYQFTWHHKLTKPEYDTSTVGKAASGISACGRSGM